MSEVTPLRIFAAVEQCEQRAIALGSDLLSRAVASARQGQAQPIKLAIGLPCHEHKGEEPPHVIVASMLNEVLGPREDETIIHERWHRYFEKLLEGPSEVFICTIFRHVPGRVRASGNDETLERIRRLNLLAVELSHSLGLRVVDYNRVLAHFGARPLATDYRLGGNLATYVAGHTLASAILANGIDELVDPQVQEGARAALGGLDDIPEQIRRFAKAVRDAAAA